MVVCEMLERGARDMLHAFALGSAASLDPMEAFCGALLEAAQSRVTCISGARDDLPLTAMRRGRIGLAPLPMLRPPVPFPQACAVPPAREAIDQIVATLAEQGFPQAGRVRLPAAHPGVHVVKCWVPGLALNDRRRRIAGRLQ
jgi:ribosomal protein S12 methylthiotransferase accessory factor YcaO